MQENLRKIIRAFLIITFSFVLIKIIMSFKKEVSVNELTESKRLISTEVVKLGSNKISVPVYCKLSSKIEINIVTEANGIFYGNNFKSGTKVSKGDTLGFIKYDELKKQREVVIKESIAYFEKAFNIDNSNEFLISTLSRLYSVIGDEEKFEYYKGFEK